jgi:hypothetical protein
MLITETSISGIAVYHRYGVEEAEMTQAKGGQSPIRDGMVARLFWLLGVRD